MDHSAGDKVRVVTEEKEIEGVLMPRPSLMPDDVVVVKLPNGYNIGISRDRVKRISLIDKYKPKDIPVKAAKKKAGLPQVSIISIGGTISSKIDYRTGAVHADYTAEDFVRMLPGLADIANLKARKVLSMMSEDLTPKEWLLMAKAIEEELKGADAVVVSQGTDTLHYSTAAMSFMLRDLNKPVVFTASQRSIDRGSSDAFMNLKCAITAAAKGGVAEVVTCLHGSSDDLHCLLIRGTKVRKMHTSRRDAFRPINELPIAKVYNDGNIEYLSPYKKTDSSKSEGVRLDALFEEKTAMLLAYPGMDPGIIDYYIDNGIKGLVISATALGHVPLAGISLEKQLRKAKEKGVPVIIASQTIYGRTHPLVYTNLRKLSIGLGCIFAEDMLPETAYVKLGWALGHGYEPDKIREVMHANIAGEITERTDPSTYLY
jgi:glutamyl-tRNA(Gln) amidotransferase subunit D